MTTYLDVLRARRLGPAAVNEASLSRLLQHVKKGIKGAASWGIITAWRAANPTKTNEERFHRLQTKLRSMGLGFVRLQGHWQECQDSVPYQQCPPDRLVDVSEPSVFVPGITRDLIDKLGAEFDQDGWIYAGPDSDGDVVLIERGGHQVNLGGFHPGRIAQAFSSLRGHSFVFEALPSSYAEALQERVFNLLRPR